jgi:hypothetical protein
MSVRQQEREHVKKTAVQARHTTIDQQFRRFAVACNMEGIAFRKRLQDILPVSQQVVP